MRGSIFDTPQEQLYLSSGMAGATMRDNRLASGHAALDQADDSATQIMRFPRAARYALLAE